MKRLSGILDRIPAAYEHAAILFLAVFGYTVCAAILAAHRDGLSYREIADHAGVSHSRVQQIVNAAK